jgi:hypothetical protein
MDPKIAVAEKAEDYAGSNIPTRPGERRIAVGILRVDVGTSGNKYADVLLVAERSRAVEGCFTFGAAVPHEAASFHPWQRRFIWICPRCQKDADYRCILHAIGPAQSCVEGRFACVGKRTVNVRTLLDQELAQPPVAVKARSVKI